MEFESYDFAHSFELSLTALTLRSSKFVRCYASLLRPDFFADPANSFVAQHCLDFFEKYNTLPRKADFDNLLGRQPDDVSVPIFERLKELSKQSIGDRHQIVGDALIEFTRTRMTYRATDAANQIWADGRADKAQRVLALYKEIEGLDGLGSQMEGCDLTSAASLREAQIFFEQDLANRVPTGFVAIDALIDGGLSAGELCVVLGGTGVGKSHIAVFSGASSIRAGKTVVHVTLEMSRFKVQRRYHSLVGRVMGRDMYTGKKLSRIVKSLRAVRAKEGRLWIHDFRTYDPESGRLLLDKSGGMRVSDVSAMLHRLAAEKDIVPDVIILDMLDQLAPDRKRDSLREESTDSVSALRNLACEHGCPVIAPTHVQRASQSKFIINLQDVGEDINRVRVADVVLAACQTAEEKSGTPPVIRLHTCKVRDAPSNAVIKYHVDYAQSNFTDAGDRGFTPPAPGRAA